MEPFKEFPQMGRFTLRDEGRTIAIGKVLKVVEWQNVSYSRNSNNQTNNKDQSRPSSTASSKSPTSFSPIKSVTKICKDASSAAGRSSVAAKV